MATVGDLGVNSHFLGGHLAVTSDENRGGSGLLIKRAKEQGGANAWESLSSGAPFSVTQKFANSRERATVSKTFKKRRPEKRKFEITVPINGSVDSSEGVVAFNCPADRSFKITAISENHQLTEDNAAAANLQVEIVLDAAAPDLNNGLIADNTIDVETSGAAVNVVSRATLNTRLANAVYGADELIVPPNSHILVNFVNDTSAAFVDTTEYIGCVTITLKEIEAELHQEKVFNIHLSDADNLAATGICIFTATGHRWRVKSIEESHAVVDNSTTANLKIETCTGTQAAAAGADLLTATAVNLKATANTVITPTITTTGDRDVLEVGDRLMLHAANDAESAIALLQYDGVVTVVVAPELSTPSTANIVSVPIEKAILITGADIFIADQDYRLVGVSMTPVIVDADNISLMLEKLSDTQAVAGGTLLVTAGALDMVGTVDTIQHVVPTAANAIITAGQRIVVYATDDDNSDAAIISTAFRGGITLFLEPINDARGTLESSFLFTNDTGKTMEVQSVSAIWEKAETHATTLNCQVERLRSTEVIGGGDKLIGDTDINVKGTKNTRDAGTVVSNGFEDLADTDRLGVYFVNDAGTRVNPGDLDGLEVTVRMQATADGIKPASDGVIFPAIGRAFKLVNVEATWETAEVTGAQTNLMIERLQDTEAAGGGSGGNGDALIGPTDIDLTGTVATVGTGTVVTASSVDVIAAGDRIAVNFVDDAGTTTIVPTELDGLQVTLYLTPVTLEAFATS